MAKLTRWPNGVIASYADVSSGTDISISHISRVMSGSRKPSMEVAAAIAAYIGIGLDEFHAGLIKRQQQRKRKSQ